jgi:hypothetical protein
MQSLLATKRNLVDVVGSVPGAIVKKDHPHTTHDTVFLHGTLKSDAVMSMTRCEENPALRARRR